ADLEPFRKWFSLKLFPVIKIFQQGDRKMGTDLFSLVKINLSPFCPSLWEPIVSAGQFPNLV
ncbi:MAG: hypothetical protein WBH22_28080, partial [Pseudomonas mandelii]|uniref:hypothetical protein n=1 Tax=Pseudomonas mandelii TaxID=75612 RepID=UPI003C771B6E